MVERKRRIDWILEGTGQGRKQNRGFIEQVSAGG
jgi:hypothetical protein